MHTTRWTMRKCPNCETLSRANEIWCTECHGDLNPHDDIEVVEAAAARTTDPDTSKLAALRAQPRVGSQRDRILQAVRRAGSAGLTAREVERLTGIDRAGRRVSELRQGGHITARGTRKDPVTKAEGEVFVIPFYAGTPAPAVDTGPDPWDPTGDEARLSLL
jgi:hypothetical protein